MNESLTPRPRPGFFLLKLGLLAGIAISYIPGLNGGFYFDDFSNIVLNPFVQPDNATINDLLAAATSSKSGPTGRPISMSSFALGYLIHGQNPYAMKLINLLLHLLNGGLLYVLLTISLPKLYNQHLAEVKKLALLLTILWLAHPLHVSTVLYIVQRMTLLSSLFMLLGLVGYCHWRQKASGRWYLALGSLALGTLLAVYSKENGLLALAYAGLIEVLLFRFENLEREVRQLFSAFFLWGPLLCLLGVACYFIATPEWIDGAYSGRSFNVLERLLTEARVVAFYQYIAIVPDLRAMGLYHDDYELSKSLLAPISTLLSFVWHGFLVLMIFLFRNTRPLISFGLSWFYISQILESTVWPLELIYEHRTYLAVAGIIIAVSGLVAHDNRFDRKGCEQINYPSKKGRLPNLILASIAITWVSATAVRAADWGDLFGHALMEASRHPASARSQFEAGQTLARGISIHPELSELYNENAQGYFRDAARLDPDDIAPLVSLLELQRQTTKQPDPALIDDLVQRLRTGKPNAATSINIHALNQQLLRDDGDFFPQFVAYSIFDAGESNSRFSSSDRAEVIVGRALYMIGHNARKNDVAALLKRATELAPNNLHYRILLAAQEIDIGAIDNARQTLAEIEKRDRFSIVADDLAHLRLRIIDTN